MKRLGLQSVAWKTLSCRWRSPGSSLSLRHRTWPPDLRRVPVELVFVRQSSSATSTMFWSIRPSTALAIAQPLNDQ